MPAPRVDGSQLPRHPFRDLEAFPRVAAAASTQLWRVVKDAYADQPWWFGNDGGGRFDLHPEAERGTCYVAFDPYGALLETVLRDVEPTGDVGRRPQLPPVKVAGRHLQQLALPADVVAGDLSGNPDHDLHGSFGVTGAELGTTPSYERTHQWAQALDVAGLGAVAYLLRRGNGRLGLALFAPRGHQPWERGERHEIGVDPDRWFAGEWRVGRLGASGFLTVHDEPDPDLHVVV